MAYMNKEGNGPYPCDAGEYCGNHQKGSVAYSALWLAKMRFGRPHACQAGTSAEMAAKGFVGLYLKEDSTSGRMPGDVHVDTPDELREPPKDGE